VRARVAASRLSAAAGSGVSIPFASVHGDGQPSPSEIAQSLEIIRPSPPRLQFSPPPLPQIDYVLEKAYPGALDGVFDVLMRATYVDFSPHRPSPVDCVPFFALAHELKKRDRVLRREM
jgi:hypothetical protein